MFGKEKKENSAETGDAVPVPQECEEEVKTAETPEAAVSEEESGSPQPAPVQEEDPVAKIAGELKEAQEKLLYLQADYQNYRRRMIKELSDARQLGVVSTLEPFLRVADFLGMADSAAHQTDNIESIRQGLTMILNEFAKAFDDLGVKKLESAGKPFDPDKQEAVLQEASETVPEGSVIKEWCPAYMLGDRCIRAAKVVVSTGKPSAPADEAGESADGNDASQEG